MPDKVVFVYRMKGANSKLDGIDSDGINFEKWRPGIFALIPPNSPISYLYLWLMYMVKIFRNSDYSAYSVSADEKQVCSLVCVPSLYKWPFMEDNDLQIKNVFTMENYRGKGYATKLIDYALQDVVDSQNRFFWYMTDENNIPSQKLCKKIGFEYMGRYRRKRNKLFLYEGEIYQDK